MSKHYNSNGSPKSCPGCGGPRLEDESKAVDGGVVSEVQVNCGDCGREVGYFAYGHWGPHHKDEAEAKL